MTEFVLSLLVIGVTVGVYHLYESRQPANKQMTWGEAMIAGTFVFFFFFWAYGVVPHFWLQWADSGLQWRADRLLQGPHIPGLSATVDGTNLGILASQQDGGWFPFRIPFLILRDIVAVLIHIILLAGNIFYWHHWQSRDARRTEAEKATEAPSEFGRPLIREGAR